MVTFFTRPTVPGPDDLCLVHTSLPGPPVFRPAPAGWWAPRKTLPPGLGPGSYLGEADGVPLWSVEAPVFSGETWDTLRSVLLTGGDGDQAKAAVRAAELAAWRRDHRYCGVCGEPTVPRAAQTAYHCEECGAEFWPRVTPAVIMVVHRPGEVLLARHTKYQGAVFSCLAGFVETGETLEEAVAREVQEEVGVQVGAPVYMGSQAWPFPHSLMVAFLVPWVSGEPVPDGVEIGEARWFTREALPPLPPAGSIARRLVRTFFQDDSI